MNQSLTQDKRTARESGTIEMEMLTVLVGSQTFGMNVSKVQSIQQYDPALLTRLPESRPGVMGMFLYRGRTVPLLDLATILGVAADRGDVREIVVVTEFNNAVNSFRVQGVNRIYRLSWQDLVPLDQVFDTQICFTGTVHVDDTQILMLDLECILADFFPELILDKVTEEAIQRQESLDRNSLKILFAEDSPTMRNGITAILKKAGFTNITTFDNGQKAFEYLASAWKTEKRSAPAVLITDIEMPQMDGLTLCRKVKETPGMQDDIHVVMFSSLINEQMIAKCRKVKADDYVTKPETNDLLKILDDRCTPR